MDVGGEVPEVDEFDSELPLFLRDPEDALRRVGANGRGEERQDGTEHGGLAAKKGEQG